MEDGITQRSGPRIPLLHSRLVTAFLPPEHREDQGYESYNHRVALIFALVFWAVALLFSGLYLFWLDAPLLAAYLGSCSLALLGLMMVVRWRGKPTWFVHALCAILLVTLGAVVLGTGGLDSPALFWLITVPGAAYAVRGQTKSTLGWMLMMMGVMALLFWMGPTEMVAGRGELEPRVEGLFRIISATILVGVIVTLFSIRSEIERWLFGRLMDKEKELRQVMEERDRDLRKALTSMMDQSPDGVVIVDRDDEVVYANEVAAEVVGQSSKGLVGQQLGAILESLGWPEWQGGETGQKERLLEMGGGQTPIHISGFWATIDGKERRVVLMRDRSREYELRQQMTKMDRIITTGTLAAGVAHEVNNPLAFIASNVDFLLRRHGDEAVDAEIIEEALEDIQIGVERVQAIVKELRQLARADAEDWAAIDVEEVVESAIRMVEHRLERRARLVRDYEEMGEILGDESGVAQVVLNLLVNALQAIPEEESSGDHRIEVAIRDDKGWVEVAVSDSGVGMSEETKRRLFEPFYTTKEEGEGTGLGLPICQNLAHSMGGTLEVESKDGEGTTVRLKWPKKEAASAQEAPKVEAAGDRKGRVLVVDDQAPLLRAMARQLKGFGEIYTAQSAEEALALAEERRPDLILSDLHMEEASGLELYQRLKERDEDMARRVVLMSGDDPSASTHQRLAEEGLEMWRKPVERDAIAGWLQAHHQGATQAPVEE